MYRLGLRLGLGSGNGFYMFLLFFSTLKSDEPLCGDATCTEQEPWPHPLGGSCDRGHETA